MKLRQAYTVTSETNDAAKQVLDAAVEVNAWKYHAEAAGWTVTFDVTTNGELALTLFRDSEWPTLDAVEVAA